jgi:hypothetical protein
MPLGPDKGVSPERSAGLAPDARLMAGARHVVAPALSIHVYFPVPMLEKARFLLAFSNALLALP